MTDFIFYILVSSVQGRFNYILELQVIFDFIFYILVSSVQGRFNYTLELQVSSI